jgi:hypothetical protein
MTWRMIDTIIGQGRCRLNEFRTHEIIHSTTLPRSISTVAARYAGS